MKTAIVTDSTAYIPKEQREALKIEMIPLNVIFGEESYREEIELSTEDFYAKIKQEKELPKTSQPAIGEFVELFERLAKDYDAVISIHLSSGISGTYQAAISASNMVEGLDVRVFDSEISCLMQGYYAIEAADLANKGASPDEIMTRLEKMKESMDALFMVDDLSHLQRGGRLTRAQALAGSLLQVKPVLRIEETKIVPYEKVRTRKKALNRIFELFGEFTKDAEQIRACVIHGNRPEEAAEIKAILEEKHKNIEVDISYFGPVIATHLGEGALGLGWYIVR